MASLTSTNGNRIPDPTSRRREHVVLGFYVRALERGHVPATALGNDADRAVGFQDHGRDGASSSDPLARMACSTTIRQDGFCVIDSTLIISGPVSIGHRVSYIQQTESQRHGGFPESRKRCVMIER